MTKEQIKKLIKKIRTRKDYYQMQKSINTIADVLDEMVLEDKNTAPKTETLQSVAERGSSIQLVQDSMNRFLFHLDANATSLIKEHGYNTTNASSKIVQRHDAIYMELYNRYNRESFMYSMFPNRLEIIQGHNTLFKVYSSNGYKMSSIFMQTATGDDAFTKQVVAKEDGTLGIIDKTQPKIITKILKEDYRPTENLEYPDVFTANLKANTTYKLELGILGDFNLLSQCIVTNDIGDLSIMDKYLTDSSMGSNNFYIVREEELPDNSDKFLYPQSSNGFSSICRYLIRPKSDCYIKIPVKRFMNNPGKNKLLAGTYMRLEEIN